MQPKYKRPYLLQRSPLHTRLSRSCWMRNSCSAPNQSAQPAQWWHSQLHLGTSQSGCGHRMIVSVRLSAIPSLLAVSHSPCSPEWCLHPLLQSEWLAWWWIEAHLLYRRTRDIRKRDMQKFSLQSAQPSLVIVNMPDSPFSVTCTLMLCEALPALFVAKHVYSPESPGSAFVITSRPSSIITSFPSLRAAVWGNTLLLSRSHSISGSGVPSAWQVNRIVSPGSMCGVIGASSISGGPRGINAHACTHNGKTKMIRCNCN